MRSPRWSLALLLAVLPLAGCTKGKECDRCDNIDDCEAGLTCDQFVLSNGDLRLACARPNTQTCRVQQ